MARVARLAGAIVAETLGQYFLVGNTKAPCDWVAAGFDPPGEVDAKVRPFVSLVARSAPNLGADCFTLDLENERLAQKLADLFVVERTGSVSERLWRLARGATDEDFRGPEGTIDGRWLGDIPLGVWRVVRDAVLRCS